MRAVMNEQTVSIAGLYVHPVKSCARIAVDEAMAFTTGMYSNFTPEFGDELIGEIYPPATLERLRSVKREVDPGDVFRASHHIAP